MNNPIRQILLLATVGASPTLSFQRPYSIPRRPHNLPRVHRRPHSTADVSSPLLASSTGWIKPSTILTTVQTPQHQPPSPTEAILIRNRLVYIKHDDRLHLPHSNISGNKARKFYALNNIPANDFPDAIVSYGGPQSNAMVALAAVVSSKNWEMEERGGDVDAWKDDDYLFWELDQVEDDIQTRAEENEHSFELISQESDDDVESIFDEIDTDVFDHEQEQNHATKPKKRFIYYTKPLPRHLKKYPNGNLLRALALGMELRTLPHGEYNELFGGLHGGSVLAPADLEVPVPGKSLWMPQGGACSLAEMGSDVMANEILDHWSTNGKGMPLAICVPGGTCTTALLLHRSIQKLMQQRSSDSSSKLDIRVVVIPCVGDNEYALRQMISLDKSVGGKGDPNDMPQILRPRSDIEYGSARRKAGGYFTFGEPAKAILQTFDELNEEGLNLDLIYGAPAFNLLLQHWRTRDDPKCPIAGRQIMYIHSGGLEGVASQLSRYKHKGLLDDARTIQS